MQDSELNRNFKWFKDSYMNLFETYGTGYFVIYHQEVISKFETLQEALQHTLLKPGTYNIQYCDGTEEGYISYIY